MNKMNVFGYIDRARRMMPLITISCQRYFLVVILASCFFTGQAQVNQRILEAGCSIMSPDTLKYFPKTSKTALGELVLHQFTCREELNNKIIKYTFQYCDYPEGTIHHDSLELLKDFFEATAESSAKAVFGSLDYSSAETINGYPGMIWRISFDKDKGLIKSHAFVKGNRYFNMKVEYPRSMSMERSLDVFMNSFQWLD